MLFTSGEFLFVYLPIALAAFFLLARVAGRAAAAFWLAVASLVFYGYWRPEHTLLLGASIAMNYLFGALILRARGEGSPAARRLLIAAVVTNLLVLGYFKYANFFVNTVSAVTGSSLDTVDVLLPLGISFFTFTQIAYLVDVHAGKVTERNPIHYLLFVTYFPHLIAGPVLHHAEMMPQFARPDIYRAYLRSMTIGLAFLTMGLAKKILVADSVAPLANDAFAQAAVAPLTTAAAWLGMVAYTLQIYFDFSGYSDMAVGLSLLIGVRLPYNFNSPYKARNISDFWRRWHMTLSRFLRDYLYIALGGNRRGRFRRYINLLVTMLLGGLWHGASWTFVVWGGLHGLYLCVNHAWQWFWERVPRESLPTGAMWSRAARVASVTLTLLAVIVAWAFFRATTIESATGIVGSLFGIGNESATSALPASAPLFWIALFSAIALFARNSQELIDGGMAKALDRVAERSWYGELLAALCGAMIVLIVLLALIAASRNVTEFIYFNF
ncbi:MAG TPA: MBOAT family O-acyltransferase [Steroidobacteraceae bacterium]|nr:MBOAT family O-acyltransferase [Steroidobacteraceae bacterium]